MEQAKTKEELAKIREETRSLKILNDAVERKLYPIQTKEEAIVFAITIWAVLFIGAIVTAIALAWHYLL